MTALRIVHVVCTDAFAGVERYVLGSALCLRAAGCDVMVIGGAEGAMREPLARVGVEWMPGRTMREAFRSLRSLGRPDVIDTHMTDADFVGVVVGLLRRVPVVSTRHFASRRGGNAIVRLLSRGIARRVAAQIAISRFVSTSVEGANTVVYTGVDAREETPEPREPIVLVLQRLEQEKKTELALRAWAEVSDRGPWRLAIAGDGGERDRLQALAKDLRVEESVDFLGFQSDVDALLRRASIFLAPTPREGLGLAVIEAMAHGLPVVASGAGGHLESVGGVEGAALFPPGDATEAARQLARLMTDAGARDRYGRALRERQETVFNLREQTEGTLRLLAAVAAGKEPRVHV
jgi:glycosyltransferase involved in cell wall biosynthesis